MSSATSSHEIEWALVLQSQSLHGAPHMPCKPEFITKIWQRIKCEHALSRGLVSDMSQSVGVPCMHGFNDDATTCVIAWDCCQRRLLTVSRRITCTTYNHYNSYLQGAIYLVMLVRPSDSCRVYSEEKFSKHFPPLPLLFLPFPLLSLSYPITANGFAERQTTFGAFWVENASCDSDKWNFSACS